jgi:hypothetical protein
MPSIIARGQITIIDYNDAVSLNSYIGANQPLTQIYTPDTLGYTPDWASGAFLKLTPQLFKSGSATDIMTAGTGVQSVTWTSNGVAVTLDANHVKNASAPFDLTVKVNELSALTQKNYECTIVWRDPVTLLDITVKSSITFTKIVNPGSLIVAIMYAPDGSVFKNGAAPSLRAHCDLWRGATIDSTNITYKWFKLTPGVFANTTSVGATVVGQSTVVLASVTGMAVGSEIKVGTHATAIISAINIGTKTVTIVGTWASIQASGVAVIDPRYDVKVGAGWSIIDATHTYGGITGYTINEITVVDASVLNYETFQCLITDTDASSPTYNQFVSDIISFTDSTDPVLVDIEAPGGTILKQGVGSTVLAAALWQAGVKIDAAGTGYTYTWSRFNESGVQDMAWGSGGYKTGKSLTVTDPDVAGKATFYVSIQTLT